jgi:hypothetical protein
MCAHVQLWVCLLAALLLVTASAQSGNSTNVTTTAAPQPLSPPPPPPTPLSIVFVEDSDSADSSRGMAIAALIVSAMSGNLPNGILASRSSILISVCISPEAGRNSFLQLPMVTPIGDAPHRYYFGSGVLNPVLFVLLCIVTGCGGLLLGSARGVSRREALSSIRYPAHLSIPLAIMVVPGVYSATVAATSSTDDVEVALSSLAIAFWFLVMLTMGALILHRFRAVYVQRMETIDDSGNVLTVRRKIRSEVDEARMLKEQQDKTSELDLNASMWNKSFFAQSSFHAGAQGGAGSDHLSDPLMEKMTDEGGAGGGSFHNKSLAGQTFYESLKTQFSGLWSNAARNEEEEENALKRQQQLDDARAVATITDAVLGSMFEQARKVGSDHLVLLYSVQGHHEWADDDEVDADAVQKQADETGRDVPEVFSEAEAMAKAARGYVQRFGTFFIYYRRKFRLVLMIEFACSAFLALLIGLHASDSHDTNCLATTCSVFAVLVVDLALHVALRPHISVMNNTYCNAIAALQTLCALLQLIAATTRSISCARAASVFIVLLTYIAALRALLDLYVWMTQRLYESGVEWPSIASLTDMHIKWQRKTQEETKAMDRSVAEADATAAARRAKRRLRPHPPTLHDRRGQRPVTAGLGRRGGSSSRCHREQATTSDDRGEVEGAAGCSEEGRRREPRRAADAATVRDGAAATACQRRIEGQGAELGPAAQGDHAAPQVGVDAAEPPERQSACAVRR